ncbi:hypothetical protein QQF64_001183, partial [Cirrhinus molitorella]
PAIGPRFLQSAFGQTN